LQLVDPSDVERAHAQINKQLLHLSALRAELRELRIQRQSASGRVSCTVDGEGTIQALTIARRSLRRVSADLLAREIKQAIDLARETQNEVAGERYRQLFAQFSGQDGFDVHNG
jgi:DNA-binding protein YbaB